MISESCSVTSRLMSELFTLPGEITQLSYATHTVEGIVPCKSSYIKVSIIKHKLCKTTRHDRSPPDIRACSNRCTTL